jgi:hypothetical protein
MGVFVGVYSKMPEVFEAKVSNSSKLLNVSPGPTVVTIKMALMKRSN